MPPAVASKSAAVAVRHALHVLLQACRDRAVELIEASFIAVEANAKAFRDNEIELGLKDLLSGSESLLIAMDLVRERPEKPMVELRKDIFALILTLIDTYGPDAVKPFIGGIAESARIAIRAEQQSLPRLAAFDVMKKLLEDSNPDEAQVIQVDQLLQELIFELRAWTKLSADRLKKAVLEVLSTLCKKYPVLAQSTAHSVAGKLAACVADPSNVVVEGALIGLNDFLDTFSDQFELGLRTESQKSYSRIYRVIISILSYRAHTRYAILHAACGLLGGHAKLFRPLICKDTPKLLAQLSHWITSGNDDVSKSATRALENVVQDLAELIVISVNDVKLVRPVYSTVVTTLSSMMPTRQGDRRLVSAAIRSTGHFAPACSAMGDIGDLEKNAAIFIDWCDRMLSDEQESKNEHSYPSSQLPVYLSSIAKMMKYIVTMDDSIIESLQKLIGGFFKSVPAMRSKSRGETQQAILELANVLEERGDAFLKTFTPAVLRDVMISVSGALDVEKPRQEYEDYAEVWIALVTDKRYASASNAIFGMFIASVQQVISSLNLNFVVGNFGEPSAPENPADFQIFLNMVELCQRVLPATDPHQFGTFALPFAELLADLLHEHPDISGLIKLMRIVVSICSAAGWFVSETKTVSQPRRLAELLKDFVPLATARIAVLEQELLFSYLEFLLGIPHALVSLASLEPAISQCLQIGLSLSKFGDLALDSLTSWIDGDHLNFHCLRDAMRPFLPVMFSYLQSSDESSNVESVAVRKRALLFIGRLGFDPPELLRVYSSLSTEVSDQFAWDSQASRVRVTFPLPPTPLPVYLDSLLPYICSVAQKSPNRRLKIAAAEMLHAVIGKCIADNARDPRQRLRDVDQRKATPFYRLYRHIFPNVLRLAVDADPVVSRIFRALAFQLCRWFSQNSRYEQREAICFVDAMVDGLADKDSALRDLCSMCLREFCRWPLQNPSKATSEDSPVSLDSVVHLLLRLSRRPKRNQRLGACLALAHLGRDLREHDDLVVRYLLQILGCLLLSVAESAVRDPLPLHRVCVDVARRAIDQYLRAITDPKHSKVQLLSNRRHIDDGVDVGFKDLHSFLSWLITEIVQRNERSFRDLCMSTFAACMPYVSGSVSLIDDALDAEQNIDNNLQSLARTLHVYAWISRVIPGNDIIPRLSVKLVHSVTWFLGQIREMKDKELTGTMLLDLLHLLNILHSNHGELFGFNCLFQDDTFPKVCVDALAGDLPSSKECKSIISSFITSKPGPFSSILETSLHLQSLSARALLQSRRRTEFISCLMEAGRLQTQRAIAKRLAHELASMVLLSSQFEEARSVMNLALLIGLSDVDLVALLTDNKPLSSSSTLTCGEQFQAVFSTVIARYLVNRDMSSVSSFIKRLYGANEGSGHTAVSAIVDATVRQFKPFEDKPRQFLAIVLTEISPRFDNDGNSLLTRAHLRILRRIGAWSTVFFSGDRTARWVEPVCTLIERCLKGPSSPAQVDAAGLLRCAIRPGFSGPADGVELRLCAAVHDMVSTSQWQEVFHWDSVQRHSTVSVCLTRLLEVLQYTRRFELFESMLIILRRRDGNNMRVRNSISSTVEAITADVARVSLARSEGMHWLDRSVALLLSPSTDSAPSSAINARVFLAECIVCPLASVLPIESVIAAHAQSIWGMIANARSDMLGAQMAFKVLSTVVKRLPDAEAVKTLVPKLGLTQVQQLVKTCSDSFSLCTTPAGRPIRAAAFTLQVETMIAIQMPQERFFVQLCLDKAKLSGVVDSDWKPVFRIETDFAMSSLRKGSNGARSGQALADPVRNSVLSSSSLSQQFASIDGILFMSENETAADEQDDVDADDSESLAAAPVLELDPINSLDAMPTVIKLVTWLATQFKGKPPDNPPDWMRCLCQTLSDVTCLVQTRLFILKVILNCPAPFEPFADIWFTPVVELVTAGDKIGGVGFHYLLRDVASLFLDDFAEYVPSGKNIESATHFLSYLVLVADDIGSGSLDSRSLQPEAKLRHNISMIRLLSKKWASGGLRVRFNTAAAHALIKGSIDSNATEDGFGNVGSRSVSCGLQLLQIPYEVGWDPHLSRDTMHDIQTCLSASSKSVFSNAAQLIGHTLRSLDHGQMDQAQTEFMQDVVVETTTAINQNQFVRAISIVRGIMQQYPGFVNKLDDMTFAKCTGWARSARGQMQLAALKLICDSAKELTEPVAKVLPVIRDAVLQQSVDVDRIVIDLVRFIIPRMTSDDMSNSVWPLIKQYVHHPDLECRSSLCKAVVSVLEMVECSEQLSLMMRRALIIFASDESDEVRSIAASFWISPNSGLPPEPPLRLATLLELADVEDSGSSKLWLGFAVSSLLQPCELSLQYSSSVSEFPLDDSASFSTLQLDGSWLPATDSSSLPMFSQSVSDKFYSASKRGPRPLFTPTLVARSVSPLLPSGPSLIAGYTLGAATGVGLSADSSEAPAAPLYRRRQRFGKREARRIQSAAIQAYDRKSREASAVQEKLKSLRQNSVTILRTYRDGEFPDIQFPLSDLIVPLRALASDQSISRQLFIILFQAIVTAASIPEQDSVRLQLGRILQRMPAMASAPSSVFVSTILLACQGCVPPLDAVDSQSICRLAQRTTCVESGILFLEHQLTAPVPSASDDVRATKRGRLSGGYAKTTRIVGDMPDLDASLELRAGLLALYGTLRDSDMVNGLANTLVANAESHHALAAVLAGRFADALSHVDKLFSSDEADALTDLEVQLCEDIQLDAQAHLGAWEDLHDASLAFEHAGRDPSDLWLPDVPYFADPSVRSRFITNFLHCTRHLPGERHALSEFAQLSLSKIDTLPSVAFDLMSAFVELGDTAVVRLLFSNSIGQILSDWCSLPPVAMTARAVLLRKLQVCAEVKEWLDVSNGHFDADKLRRLWGQRFPASIDPSESMLLDEIVHNRMQFLTNDASGQEFVFNLGADAAQLCIAAGNAELSMHFLDISRQVRPDDSRIEFLEVTRALTSPSQSDPTRFALMQLGRRSFSNLLDQLEALRIVASGLLSLDDVATARQFMHSALELVRRPRNGGANAIKIADCLVTLANCFLDDESSSDAVASMILEAMKLGSVKAFGAFPAAFEISSKSGAIDNFRRQCAAVPSWMFLYWRAQLISQVAVDDSDAVMDILERIAKDYPHALIYPLEVASQDERHADSLALQRLGGLIDLPMTRRVVDELSRVTFPELQFKDFVQAACLLVRHGSYDSALRLYRLFSSKWLRSRGVGVPDIARTFLEKYEKALVTAFGEDGQSLQDMTSKDFDLKCATILSSMKVGDLPDGYLPLRSFSPFLASFSESFSATNDYVEMPGQYDGRSRPNADEHVRVVSFDSSVHVMHSIRRPVRAVIFGSDERAYAWLVKCGEDLRLDERIQLLFREMNASLDSDPACARRNLAIGTYSVIPMTRSLGLIEWIPDTMPLGSVVENRVGQKVLHDCSDAYSKALTALSERTRRKSKKPTPLLQTYMDLFESGLPDDDVVAAFHNTHSGIPRDLLSRIATSLCNSPEAFLTIRTALVTSFAVGSIASYIVGIGDRHLDNFLVGERTGRIVQIDFGVAFGAGLDLAVPELVPIRFTPMFQSAMYPLHLSYALMHQTMAHALRAFRAHRSHLVSVMSVFVREPHVDWQAEDLRFEQDGGATSPQAVASSGSASLAASSRIATARSKLEGRSSVQVMLGEFARTKHATSRYAGRMKDLITGAGGRPDYGADPLSVDDQVACLLEHASDPALLGRSWQGWRPFV